MRVSDASNPGTFDVSDAAFTIAIPLTLTVLQPDGGENLVTSSTYSIDWQSTGIITDVSLEYSDSNGLSWLPIDAGTPNDGQYDWVVPDANSPDCLLRVADVSNPSQVNDTSDAVFTVFECEISLFMDFDGDCYVNLSDFSMFAYDWLLCGNKFDPLCN